MSRSFATARTAPRALRRGSSFSPRPSSSCPCAALLRHAPQPPHTHTFASQSLAMLRFFTHLLWVSVSTSSSVCPRPTSLTPPQPRVHGRLPSLSTSSPSLITRRRVCRYTIGALKSLALRPNLPEAGRGAAVPDPRADERAYALHLLQTLPPALTYGTSKHYPVSRMGRSMR